MIPNNTVIYYEEKKCKIREKEKMAEEIGIGLETFCKY
jgi:hypothetical protein